MRSSLSFRPAVGDRQLMGVVMCGGRSSRMGRDKGLIEKDGVCWAVRMGMKLAPFGMPVVYSVRAEQEAAYSAMLPEVCLIIDALDVGGPLNGLLSVHQRFPESDLLLLACDMQDMDAGTIGGLIEVYRCERGYEWYGYADSEFVQPFCGIYAGALMERGIYADALMERGINADALMERPIGKAGEDLSFQGLIRKGEARRLRMERPDAFRNYNTM